MSGHSKWNNIKNTKGKADAERGKIFTKIGRELAVAVKEGGADPNLNSKLYDVIAKAKQNNMPNDNIARSIKKASGELSAVNYVEMLYEGYGAGGVAFIVECLTDNKNRTAGDVRHSFDKHGGSLGTNGSVTFMFDRKGVIVLEKQDKTEDEILELVLEAGAEDMQSEEDVYIVTTQIADLHNVQKAFEEKGIKIEKSGLEYIASNFVDVDEATQAKVERLVETLEDLDDVQNVYHNANI